MSISTNKTELMPKSKCGKLGGNVNVKRCGFINNKISVKNCGFVRDDTDYLFGTLSYKDKDVIVYKNLPVDNLEFWDTYGWLTDDKLGNNYYYKRCGFMFAPALVSALEEACKDVIVF